MHICIEIQQLYTHHHHTHFFANISKSDLGGWTYGSTWPTTYASPASAWWLCCMSACPLVAVWVDMVNLNHLARWTIACNVLIAAPDLSTFPAYTIFESWFPLYPLIRERCCDRRLIPNTVLMLVETNGSFGSAFISVSHIHTCSIILVNKTYIIVKIHMCLEMIFPPKLTKLLNHHRSIIHTVESISRDCTHLVTEYLFLIQTKLLRADDHSSLNCNVHLQKQPAKVVCCSATILSKTQT